VLKWGKERPVVVVWWWWVDELDGSLRCEPGGGWLGKSSSSRSGISICIFGLLHWLAGWLGCLLLLTELAYVQQTLAFIQPETCEKEERLMKEIMMT
jgi:hypothetical protein